MRPHSHSHDLLTRPRLGALTERQVEGLQRHAQTASIASSTLRPASLLASYLNHHPCPDCYLADHLQTGFHVTTRTNEPLQGEMRPAILYNDIHAHPICAESSMSEEGDSGVAKGKQKVGRKEEENGPAGRENLGNSGNARSSQPMNVRYNSNIRCTRLLT